MRGKSIFLWTALFLTATLVQAKDDNSPVINIKGNIEQNTISVNGETHKWITPDRIYLNIIIDENDTKGKISLESLESKMIDQLTQLGIDIKKQLKTESMTNSLENFRKGTSRTRKSYQLLLHSADQVVEVYCKLDNIGLSQITIGEVTHSKIEEYKDEVQAASVQEARQRAIRLAGAIGQTIGKAISINAYGTPSVSGYSSNKVLLTQASRSDSSAGGMSSQPSIDFKSIKITASTNVTFILN